MSAFRRRWLRSHQLLRFLVVGMANTIVGYALYLIGLWIGAPYEEALTGATVLGAIFNFFTTGRFVFESRALNRIFGFLAVYGIMLAINLALLTWLVRTGVEKAYAQAFLLPLVVLLSYFLNKRLVFGRLQ